MLKNPLLQNCVMYIQGSALIDKDLQRCHVDSAVAIFILANKFTSRADEEDARTILQWLSIKRFSAATKAALELVAAPSAETCGSGSFCLQLIRPENQRHIDANEIGKVKKTDSSIVICLNEIKMGILAKAIMFPGTNALIMNLVSSFAEMDDDEDEAELEQDEAARKQKLLKSVTSRRDRKGSIFSVVNDKDEKPADEGADKDDKEGKEGKDGPPKQPLQRKQSFKSTSSQAPAKKEKWLIEYQQGCDWEIYCTKISDVFHGCKFADMSFLVYEHMRVVVFGLELHDKQSGVKRVILNPGSYYLPREGFEVQVFVLAKNKAEADQLDNLTQMDELFFATAFHRAASTYTPYLPRQQSSENFGTLASQKSRMPMLRDASKQSVGASSSSVGEGGKSKRNLWKLLKRSNLLQKKIELDSLQEKLQKMEEKHMATFYYHRPNPVALEDCYVKTSVIDEVGHINNHLIITGKDITNLYDLIRPLRAKYLGSLKYIVILYPGDIPFDIWRRICYFDAILVVRGSSLEEIDLRRAGIFRASQVVVLADAARENSDMEGGSAAASEFDSLVDSDAIFTYQCVKRLNPHTHVVVEIVNHENIAYLDHKDALASGGYKFMPQFASGSLFTTALLDSLVCQAFYSPMIIEVVNKLVSGIDHLDRGELEAQALEASTSGLSSGKLDTSDGTNINVSMNEVPLKSIVGSCLYLISIPDALGQGGNKRIYGNLYRLLARENKIPLGLLRGTFSHMAVGPKANRMPYVFTNPDHNSEVFACDRVFVLSMDALQANRLQVKVNHSVLFGWVVTFDNAVVVGLDSRHSNAQKACRHVFQ
jgi:hypothetical protein